MSKKTQNFNLTTTIILNFLLLALSINAAEVVNPYGEEDLLSQPRASKKHDRITFIINEKTNAKHETTTDTSKESTVKWSLAKLFKIDKDRDGDIIATAFPNARKPELDISSLREHKGEGETEAKNTTKTELSGEVLEVMPNGHLVVEARSEITINAEKREVIFTGRVDPRDLAADNSINAKFVMGKSIKFIGQGDLTDATKRGWLAKVFDFLSPF